VKESLQRSIARAVRLFTGFRGANPAEVRSIQIPATPRVVLTIGDLVAIVYLTERDGELVQATHRFKKSARPILAVTPDGHTLLILGGDYRVTHNGIEDAA